MPVISIQEAAQRLGVTVSTIRRRIRRGELKGVQESTPQGFVWMVELPESAGPEPVAPESSDRSHEALWELVETLRQQVEASYQQMEFWKGQLETKDRQIGELHVLLQQAQMTLPAPEDVRPWWRRLWRR